MKKKVAEKYNWASEPDGINQDGVVIARGYMNFDWVCPHCGDLAYVASRDASREIVNCRNCNKKVELGYLR